MQKEGIVLGHSGWSGDTESLRDGPDTTHEWVEPDLQCPHCGSYNVTPEPMHIYNQHQCKNSKCGMFFGPKK